MARENSFSKQRGMGGTSASAAEAVGDSGAGPEGAGLSPSWSLLLHRLLQGSAADTWHSWLRPPAQGGQAACGAAQVKTNVRGAEPRRQGCRGAAQG